jgi:hypothetical protein
MFMVRVRVRVRFRIRVWVWVNYPNPKQMLVFGEYILSVASENNEKLTREDDSMLLDIMARL